MKHYIFITHEGYTFQPKSDLVEPEVENCQVLDSGSGKDENEAFNNFLKEYSYLKNTSFDDIVCFELANESSIANFSLKS